MQNLTVRLRKLLAADAAPSCSHGLKATMLNRGLPFYGYSGLDHGYRGMLCGDCRCPPPYSPCPPPYLRSGLPNHEPDAHILAAAPPPPEPAGASAYKPVITELQSMNSLETASASAGSAAESSGTQGAAFRDPLNQETKRRSKKKAVADLPRWQRSSGPSSQLWSRLSPLLKAGYVNRLLYTLTWFGTQCGFTLSSPQKRLERHLTESHKTKDAGSIHHPVSIVLSFTSLIQTCSFSHTGCTPTGSSARRQPRDSTSETGCQ